MFFLARSVFCIGLVAFLLPASERSDDWKGIAESAEAAAAGQIRSLCSAAPSECVEATAAKLILSDRLEGAVAPANVRQSVSTLQAADLVPAWNGPAPRP